VAEGAFAWLKALWAYVDERLANFAKSLRKVLRLLRLTQALLVIGILAVLASAVVGLVWPDYFAYTYAVATIFLILPLVILVVLVALPLRAKSIVRLIDKGYPANARELAIRVAARKLRDQSIETEELLVETAVNESRKVYERYKSRTQTLERDENAAPPRSESPPSAPPAPPRGPGP
jgi:hypothetical protein